MQDMIDGFHWTRVTAKQLRFLCEEFALPPSGRMRELACRIDRELGATTHLQPAADAPRSIDGSDQAGVNAAYCGAEPRRSPAR